MHRLVSCRARADVAEHLHFTLAVALGGVLQEALVLDGDSVALLGNGAIAFLENSLCNTHV